MATKDLLTKLGFTEKEAVVYIKIIEHPRISYNQLSDITNINRSTVYSVTKKLIERGFIVEDLGSNVSTLFAKEPSNLVLSLQKQEAGLKRQIELAKRASLELSSINPKANLPEPSITYTSEQSVRESFITRTTVWDKSLANSDSTIWGFQDSKFEPLFADFINSRKDKYISGTIYLKLFSDDPQYSEQYQPKTPNVQIKYWPNILNFEASFYIQGEYMVILSLDQAPRYMVEIKDPLLANNFRNFFKAMWLTSENLPEIGKAS